MWTSLAAGLDKDRSAAKPSHAMPDYTGKYHNKIGNSFIDIYLQDNILEFLSSRASRVRDILLITIVLTFLHGR